MFRLLSSIFTAICTLLFVPFSHQGDGFEQKANRFFTGLMGRILAVGSIFAVIGYVAKLLGG